MSGLSERDMRILAFERRGWRTPGVKEQAIAEVLDMPATRYYQLLNELIDRPEALEFDPVLVKRLRAQRGRRQRMRSPRPRGARGSTGSSGTTGTMGTTGTVGTAGTMGTTGTTGRPG